MAWTSTISATSRPPDFTIPSVKAIASSGCRLSSSGCAARILANRTSTAPRSAAKTRRCGMIFRLDPDCHWFRESFLQANKCRADEVLVDEPHLTNEARFDRRHVSEHDKRARKESRRYCWVLAFFRTSRCS